MKMLIIDFFNLLVKFNHYNFFLTTKGALFTKG